MPWPRKAILIRLAIYIPLIGYLGWSALNRYASTDADTPASEAPKSRTITTEDGRTVEVIELSPQQAAEMFGVSPEEIEQTAALANDEREQNTVDVDEPSLENPTEHGADRTPPQSATDSLADAETP